MPAIRQRPIFLRPDRPDRPERLGAFLRADRNLVLLAAVPVGRYWFALVLVAQIILWVNLARIFSGPHSYASRQTPSSPLPTISLAVPPSPQHPSAHKKKPPQWLPAAKLTDSDVSTQPSCYRPHQNTPNPRPGSSRKPPKQRPASPPISKTARRPTVNKFPDRTVRGEPSSLGGRERAN